MAIQHWPSKHEHTFQRDVVACESPIILESLLQKSEADKQINVDSHINSDMPNTDKVHVATEEDKVKRQAKYLRAHPDKAQAGVKLYAVPEGESSD